MAEKWQGEDWFIRPNLLTGVTYEQRQALAHIAGWRGKDRSNLLVVLGNLGTGKSTLMRFLAYKLALAFCDDPLRHPAPMLIPLKDVRGEETLESMVSRNIKRYGLKEISFSRFEHLVRLGKIILLFDAFDEMAERIRIKETRRNFLELSRPAENGGKVILTCRTHFFRDRNEQATVIGEGPRLSEIESNLARAIRETAKPEIVELCEFDEAQIQDYLRKARPGSFSADWQTMKRIHNLQGLATIPLLLDMIVKTLDKLKDEPAITAINLYRVYVNDCFEREEKDKLRELTLDRSAWFRTLQETSWQIWREGEETRIHYKQIVPVIQRLADAGEIDIGNEDPRDVAREVQVASLLKRDEGGNFEFMHRSFMEFFLAHRFFDCAANPGALDEMLAARLFDKKAIKVIMFLALLDEHDVMREPLRRILTEPYKPIISENALLTLYWTARIREEMEEQITDLNQLRQALAVRIPLKSRLAGAQLREAALECIDLSEADLSGADLSEARLNHARFDGADLRKAMLVKARFDNASASGADFREAVVEGASFNEARLEGSDFSGVETARAGFVNAGLDRAKGITRPPASRKTLYPIVQHGHRGPVNSVAYSPDGELMASGGGDGLILIWRASDGKLIRALEGHTDSVSSVAFAHDGSTLASGSNDNSVRLWEVKSGKCLMELWGNLGAVRSVAIAPNGKYLVAAGAAGRLQFWDLATGETFLYVYDFGEGAHLTLLPDGRFDASPEGLRYLSFIEQGTNKSYDAEELAKEFYDPDGVRAVLAKYV